MKGLLLILMLIACFTGITKLGSTLGPALSKLIHSQALRRSIQERIGASRQEMEGRCFRGEPLVLEASTLGNGRLFEQREMQVKIQLKVCA